MDPALLPDELRSDRRLHVSAADYPLRQVNPVTGYRTSLYRSGRDADFVGWIHLVNGDMTAGYIYIQRPVFGPALGYSRYVIMDVLPELLGPLLKILQSDEPLQIRFYQGAADAEAASFLEHKE
ncbi:hypothetical protein [Nocardia gamkensis]|uniref:Uncharacterized protein n=1 Tax=Nocardia gamkensis TaxID=352869 RepID=A0A7X6R224_9NOCA|nr:hypothetical protein [Nocardia gamkensis]NKY25868.1 hypothetical protein [Nocardia gamkensis]NQE68939.1 hypothetical protein [Nocardia gamkensis]